METKNKILGIWKAIIKDIESKILFIILISITIPFAAITFLMDQGPTIFEVFTFALLGTMCLFLIHFKQEINDISEDNNKILKNVKRIELQEVSKNVKQSEFYMEIKDSLQKSNHKVYLMYLEPFIPNQSYEQADIPYEQPYEQADIIKEKVDYFRDKNTILEKKFKNDSFQLYQILSIENPDKLRMALDMIKKFKNQKNFNLNCVGFSTHDNMLIQEEKIEGLSIQIIDESKVFIISRRIKRPKEAETDYISSSYHLLQVLRGYYNEIWDSSIPIVNCGILVINKKTGKYYIDEITELINKNR